jgi:recombination protein RecA
MSHTCPEPGCTYSAKTKGAVTQHVNREHKGDPMAALRNSIPGAPRPGGVMTDKPMEAAPSGIPSIDWAIGIGGVPRGAIAEIFGPSHSGKTFTALTFSAYAQQQGQRAGYMNAERAPMQTFLPLIPGLDIPTLEYGEPPVADPKASKADREQWDGSGQATLEASRRFIRSGEFGVWTIDSVHSLVSRDALDAPIGSPRASAALARLMSEAVPVMEHEIHNTNTLCIFVNHVKQVPQAKYGRDWSKPGGSALDYYASVQLHVSGGKPYYREGDGRRIGHIVKVRVHKNKVAMPHATAQYDLFYGAGKLKEDGRIVTPGVDVTSCWLSVLDESKTIRVVNECYFDDQGEVIGTEAEVREQMEDTGSSLYETARKLVYPEVYRLKSVA